MSRDHYFQQAGKRKVRNREGNPRIARDKQQSHFTRSRTRPAQSPSPFLGRSTITHPLSPGRKQAASIPILELCTRHTLSVIESPLNPPNHHHEVENQTDGKARRRRLCFDNPGIVTEGPMTWFNRNQKGNSKLYGDVFVMASQGHCLFD